MSLGEALRGGGIMGRGHAGRGQGSEGRGSTSAPLHDSLCENDLAALRADGDERDGNAGEFLNALHVMAGGGGGGGPPPGPIPSAKTSGRRAGPTEMSETGTPVSS